MFVRAVLKTVSTKWKWQNACGEKETLRIKVIALGLVAVLDPARLRKFDENTHAKIFALRPCLSHDLSNYIYEGLCYDELTAQTFFFYSIATVYDASEYVKESNVSPKENIA